MNDMDVPSPWSQSRLTSLRRVAAEIYPREVDQRRLVKEAGLREASVRFDPSSDNSWFEILRYADLQRATDRLLDFLLRENPDNDLLWRIKDEKPAPILDGMNIKGGVAWQGPKNARPLLEKIIGGKSALVPVSYLALGLRRARSVAKVRLESGASGSGFLIEDNVLVTNNHVLPDEAAAAAAVAQFNFQLTVDGADEPMEELKLRPDKFFATSRVDDWSAVRIDGAPNQKWGALDLRTTHVNKDDRVNIIQHPGGGYKQISFFSNVVVFTGGGRVQYLTDTLPGSSGSPVFDRNWDIVALHHSGGWLIEAGSDSNATFYRNEGILIDVVIAGIAAAKKGAC